MLDATELAKRIREAMDKRQPTLTSAALAAACSVTPQAVYEWRKTGRVSKGYLSKIAAETGKPLEYFLGEDQAGISTNVGLVLGIEEAEAIKRLRDALPQWRAYVFNLAITTSREKQKLWLEMMNRHVPDERVEKTYGDAPHVAARKREREKK